MKLRFLIIFSWLFILSCTSDLDFDQADRLEIHPVFEGDIFYFDLQAPNLTNDYGVFRATITDTVDFNIFDDSDIRDAFVRAEIEVAFDNSFERNFYTELFFKDENLNTVAQASLNIAPATSTNTTVVGDAVFVFDTATNPNFVNFRKIIIQITVSPDDLPIEDKLLHMQSKGIFYTQYTLE